MNKEVFDRFSDSRGGGVIKRLYHLLIPRSLRLKLRLRHRLDIAWKKLTIPVKVMLSLPVREPHRKIQFEINLVEHCNLNCVGCNHFSPIADPEFVDVEEFRRDMKRMGEIFNHECERIYLLGGEPLLHPEIISMIKISRNFFQSGRIVIITNGILLPRQSDDFWCACHDHNVQIRISSYPIKLDENAIESLAQKFNVKVWWVREDAQEFLRCRIDLSGKGNIKRNFALCQRANACIMLSHGRLFTCTFAPTVRHFNKKFNKNIPITEEDYIDIYNETDRETILKKLASPIPLCGYCKVPDVPTRWSVSKREADEWL